MNNQLTHLDLFSGIGGFALAAEWANIKTIGFCEIDQYCQEVLKKNFPNTPIYDDIRQFPATDFTGGVDILTGGFPCQPFSQAGKRKGTDDNRHLWPEMLRVIQIIKPTWIIAENVRGLLTIGQGMVFEQVCTDLENNGYEVQPFVIPAVAVNAPHRRDRVWFVAHNNKRQGGPRNESEPREQAHSKPMPDDRNITSNTDYQQLERSKEYDQRGECGQKRSAVWCEGGTNSENVADTEGKRGQRGQRGKSGKPTQLQERLSGRHNSRDWNQNWIEIATKFCGVDDGLSVELDGFKLSKSRHRVERLKALGNAIVPQVAYQIFNGIQQSIFSEEEE